MSSVKESYISHTQLEIHKGDLPGVNPPDFGTNDSGFQSEPQHAEKRKPSSQTPTMRETEIYRERERQTESMENSWFVSAVIQPQSKKNTYTFQNT